MNKHNKISLYIQGIEERKKSSNNQYKGHRKYYYKLNITIGFIVGIVIDQIIPLTFGLPIRLLKGIGRPLYSREIRLNKYMNNRYIRGFLE